MSRTEIWIAILGMGLITFAIRASFLLFSEHFTLSRRLARALKYVPAAVLAAIITPTLVLPAGEIDLSITNVRLLAGIIAAIVAWRSRSILLTIVTGMAALWITQWLVG
jgi:branched-subunit amino acid transport protein